MFAPQSVEVRRRVSSRAGYALEEAILTRMMERVLKFEQVMHPSQSTGPMHPVGAQPRGLDLDLAQHARQTA